ncbi:MAG: hypothetical protein M3430_14155 [Acidobacteriota bacterium]|nr:hypothetical protein [Acidobacteriota bacterium]
MPVSFSERSQSPLVKILPHRMILCGTEFKLSCYLSLLSKSLALFVGKERKLKYKVSVQQSAVSFQPEMCRSAVIVLADRRKLTADC